MTDELLNQIKQKNASHIAMSCNNNSQVSGFWPDSPVFWRSVRLKNDDQTGQAIVRFLVLSCIVLQTAQHQSFRDIVSQNKHLIKAAQCDSKYHKWTVC